MVLTYLPVPHDDESFMSLAQRMAKANCHQTLQTLIDREGRWFDYRANLNYFKHDTLWNTKIIDLLKDNGYADLDRHMLNQFDPILFRGEPTLLQLRQHYYQTQIKYCPRCIEEGSYHRLLWDVSLVGVCLKHDVSLIESCPCCERVIRMDNLIGGGCICGFKYESLMATKKPNPRVRKAQNVIVGLLNGDQIEVQIEGGEKLSATEYFEELHLFMKLLDNLPLSVLPFDNLDIGNERFNYNLVKGEKKNLSMFLLLSTAAHELMVTPSLYFGSIVDHIELKKSAHRSRSSTRFKRSLFDCLINKKKFHVHRSIYMQVHNESSDEFVRMLTVLKEEERKYCSLLNARRILRCDDKRLLLFRRLGLLQFFERSYGERKITLVEKQQVQDLANRRKEHITTGEVAQRLGIPQKMVVKLAQANLLPMEHGPEKDGYGRRVFVLSTLNALICKLDKCSVYLPQFDRGWIPLQQIELHQRCHHASFSAVVQAVLMGRIRSGKIVNTIADFQHIMISAADFARFYDLKGREERKMRKLCKR